MGETRIRLDAAPAPVRASKRRPRRWGRLVRVGCLVALPVVIYAFHQWWVSPERLLRRFVAAVQRRDAHAIIACVDPEELRRLDLTPNEILELLDAASGSVGRLAVGDPQDFPVNEHTGRFRRMITVALYDRAGRPLPHAKGRPTAARVFVEAYRTPRGWRVGLSKFIFSLTRSVRPERGVRIDPYTALCNRFGMRNEFFEPANGEWKSLRRQAGRRP